MTTGLTGLSDAVCVELAVLHEQDLSGIGTLGPAGTSSEQAAVALWRRQDRRGDEPVVRLYDSYELAADQLRAGAVSHLVVANAYRDVNCLYMSRSIALAAAFVLDTPHYGLARAAGAALPDRPSVASHPAPVPLIEELLPAGLRAGRVVLTSSTSTAAGEARERRTDLALTTEIAARANKLTFVSRTRPIRMLWSVFVRSL